MKDAIIRAQQSHCLSSSTTVIVLAAIPKLSGRVMTATREILAPSSSLSPINDPIRSDNQIWLSGAAIQGDHALEMHYMHVNHLTEITRVCLILIKIGMSV